MKYSLSLLSLVLATLLNVASFAYAAFPPCDSNGKPWREGNKTYYCYNGAWQLTDSDKYESVTRYGAVCDGVSDISVALGLADTAAIASGKSVYIPSCPNGANYKASTNVDITSPVRFENNAVIDIDALATVTFSGDLSAGNYQIFSGEGGLSVPEVKMEWFGAVADGATDNAPFIQKAINSATKKITCASWDSTFNFGSQITNPEVKPFICETQLNFTGSGEDAFVIGKSDAYTIDTNNTISNISIKRNTTDHTDQYSGVKIQNTWDLDLTVDASYFYKGLELYAGTGELGTAHCRIYPSRFVNNVHSISLKSVGNGFVTQNYIEGGDLSSNVNVAEVASGIYMENTATHSMNNNVFLNTSCQITNANTVTGNEAAIRTEGTSTIKFNRFISIRAETAGTHRNGDLYILAGDGLFENNDVYPFDLYEDFENDVILGGTSDQKYKLANNRIESAGMNPLSWRFDTIAEISRQDATENSEGVYVSPKAIWWNYSDLGVFTSEPSSASYVPAPDGITVDADYIDIGYGSAGFRYNLGWKIDASQENQDLHRILWLKIEAEEGSEGRIGYLPYDSGNNVLTGDKYKPNQSFVYDSGYYYTGTLTGPPEIILIPIFIDDDVDHFYIGMHAGVDYHGKIKKISLYSEIGSKMAAVLDSAQIGSGDYANSDMIPIDTTATEGTFVLNSEPSEGEPLGWRFDGSTWEGVYTPTNADVTLDADTGDEVAYNLEYTTNKATSGNDIGLQIVQTDTLSPGTSLLIDALVGASTVFRVNNSGQVSLNGGTVLLESQISPNGHDKTLIVNGRNFTAADDMTAISVGTASNSSGVVYATAIRPTYNQSGTASSTDLLINRTETAVGSGAQNLIDAQVATASKFKVSNVGQLTTAAGIQAAKVTADPCGTYPEGSIFYNDTSNYYCFCDGTNDVQLHSPGTACF